MLDVPAAGGGANAAEFVAEIEYPVGRTVRLLLSGALDGWRAQTVRRGVIDALRRTRRRFERDACQSRWTAKK